MRFKASKGQHLIEFGLIATFVFLVGIVVFSPVGNKVQDMFNKLVVKQNLVASASDLSGAVSSDSSLTTISSNLKTLSSSSNSAASNLAAEITSFLNSLALINTGESDKLSKKDADKVLKEMTSETSGSLAVIMANLSAVDVNKLSDAEKAALEAIKGQLTGKIQINPAKSAIQESATAAVASIKESILNNTLSSDVLLYEGSPVTAADIQSKGIEAVFAEYYSVTNDATLNNTLNALNTYMLGQSVISTSKASPAVADKIEDYSFSLQKSLEIVK